MVCKWLLHWIVQDIMARGNVCMLSVDMIVKDLFSVPMCEYVLTYMHATVQCAYRSQRMSQEWWRCVP